MIPTSGSHPPLFVLSRFKISKRSAGVDWLSYFESMARIDAAHKRRMMLQHGKASFDGDVFTIAELFQVATTVFVYVYLCVCVCMCVCACIYILRTRRQ